MDLPAQIADAVEPVFVFCPADQALARLVPDQGASPEVSALVETTIQAPAIAARPTLVSALWLYVDELDRSHVVSQGIDDTTGSFWHGIMHRREPDYPNAKYWFNQTGRHEAFPEILKATESVMSGTDLAHLAEGEWDPFAMVDAVSRAKADTAEYALLQKVQRIEFEVLLERFCA